MTGPVAYLNGRYVPFAEAGLPLNDAGFVSGATVVDNARTYGRKLFRWADHQARFRRDCAACYVPLAATDKELTRVAEELIARNGALLPPDGELQVVTFATPGPLGFYVGEATNGPPTLGMATHPVPARYARFAEEGVTLAVAGWQGAESWHQLVPPRVKHRSRMHWHVAERIINDPGCPCYRPGAVPVVVTEHGVGDTPIGGILVVADDKVYFPPEGAVLDGITFKVVTELCGRLRIPTRTLSRAPLEHFAVPTPKESESALARRATEMILCGTGFGLAAVREFALLTHLSRTYPCPGPVLTQLREAWEDEVGRPS